MSSKIARVDKGFSISKEAEHFASLPYRVVITHYEEQGGFYLAQIGEIPKLHMAGKTAEEALAKLNDVKAEWFELELRLGRKPPLPAGEAAVDKSKVYNGKISLRIAPALHAELDSEANREKISLNQLLATYAAYGLNSLSHERRVSGSGAGAPGKNRNKTNKAGV
jgi:predicted RNase H-like HicB family nuclease